MRTTAVRSTSCASAGVWCSTRRGHRRQAGDAYVEEWFPWGERTQPLVAESDVASAFMRASLFARRYSFSDVPDEVWHELSGVLDGYAEKASIPRPASDLVLPMQDYDAEGYAIPKLDDGQCPTPGTCGSRPSSG